MRTTRWASPARAAARVVVAAALPGAFAAGCRRAPQPVATPDPKQVVATWTGGAITRAEVEAGFARRLGREPGATPERQAEMLRLALERRVRIEMLYRDAQQAGLTGRADVQAALRAQEERLLAEDWLERQVAAKARATDAQVEAEVARRAGNAGQETRSFSHIFLRAAAGEAEARRKAAETMAAIRRELGEGAAFDELARRHSDSITARGGGRVEWTTRAPLDDAVAAAVFSMAEGQVSDVVETGAGLHLFRLDGIRRPAPADPEGLRADVRRALDAEAGRAAAQAERQRVFDESAVRLDARALARPPRPDEVVATVAGEPLRRDELEHVRASALALAAPGAPAADAARALVVDRLIARKRRAEPLDAALTRRLEDARRNLVVDARRHELIATLPADVTPAEIGAFYGQNRESAAFLRDHVIDVLFFAQTGPSQAEVYSKGETVSKRLRDGESFDAILGSHAARPLVARRVPAGDLDSLRDQSNRLFRAVSRLAVGEVSSPVYMDGEKVSFRRPRPLIEGKGVAFVRLVEIRPQPLEAARERIREALRRQKEAAGVGTLQQRLNEQAQLKILVDRL